MRLPLLLAAASLVLAGCLSSTSPGEVTRADAGDEPLAALLDELRQAPAPALSGEDTLAWLGAFTSAHKPRITGTPQEKAAGDALAAELAALGYEVQDHRWNAQGLPSVDGPLRAVVGVKVGASEPERLIILGGHYDTSFLLGNADVPVLPFGTGLTMEAAYDNGSGTAMVMELARQLANVTTARTIQFAFFNGEEESLLASDAYAADLVASAAQVDAYVGFDMVGINWPSAAGCLCIYSGEKFADAFNPVQELVAFDLLGYPRSNETVQVFPDHKTRSSDEAAFQAVGFPTMRWAGMKSAGDYWAYHKLNDTIETMARQAGGMDVLADGFETAAASAYYTVLALDRVDGPIPG